MVPRKAKIQTAIGSMAVLLLGLLLGACVTPHHIDELRADVAQAKAENRKTQQMVSGIDSLMANFAEENRKFRTDVSYTTDELHSQIGILLENYNELMAMLNQLDSKGRITHVVRSSPGVQQQGSDTIVTGQDTSSRPVRRPAIDCQKTYDEAFILVRQSEYDKAINDFQTYLSECGYHASAENAHYWIGECFYSLGKFVDAIERFQMLIDQFKGSVNSGRALYKLGRCHQELGQNDKAKAAFQQVIDGFPQTLEAEQSKERLKDLG